MPSSSAAAAGYRPRAASNQLKEIVEDSTEELFRVWDDRFRDRYGAIQDLHVPISSMTEWFRTSRLAVLLLLPSRRFS